MAANVGDSSEFGADDRDTVWTALQERWTVVQDAENPDPALKKHVGIELKEEIEGELSYISILGASEEEEKEKPHVVVHPWTKKKEESSRAGPGEWIKGSKLLQTFTLENVTFTLIMQISYKKCKGRVYEVQIAILDILWDCKMDHNGSCVRGFFVDRVEIVLTPNWEGDRIAQSFEPKAANDFTEFVASEQRSLAVNVSPKPAAILGGSKLRSHSVSQPFYISKWERKEDTVIFTWILNVWCPLEGSGTRAVYKFEDPSKGPWGTSPGAGVPNLFPGYENGNFSGLNLKPKVSWRVQSSTVENNKISWSLTLNARSSKLRARKLTDLRFTRNWKLQKMVKVLPAIQLEFERTTMAWIGDRLTDITKSTWIIIICLVPVLAILAAWELGR